MGRTQLGEATPYCPKCSDYVGTIKTKFGTLCPRCGTPTVDYSEWKWRQAEESFALLRRLREGEKR